MGTGTRTGRATGTEHGGIWGTCDEVDGLFGEADHETYELLGWVPEEPAAADGWVGSRVWLVPEDEGLDPWLLSEAEALGPRSGTDCLVLSGVDGHEGPPGEYRGAVRVHDEHRWLGSCRGFDPVPPDRWVASPIVLRGLAPSARLQRTLDAGTREAFELDQPALQIRDGQGGGRLTDRLLWGRVRRWGPSSHGADLIDLELDTELARPVPAYVRPVVERWLAGPPDTPGAWADLDTRQRGAWLDLVRERARPDAGNDRPAGHTYVLDGRHVTDVPGLYLALGEAVNGPGGYFGGCLAAVDDCLGGAFGHTAPATLVWKDAATARAHLSRALTPDGEPYDLFAEVLDVLAGKRMRVCPA
ncbi:hypothetical protein ACFVGY_06785 [Streptomyces sp. NPDC127106]|uniref:barstar family protein n=1 Tax=Streptomyces sp. NPDC127106 TaxID=3345360 RepID=UPI003628D90F